VSYTGMFAGGVPHGFGEKHSGASVYKGRFENGMRHGRGLLLDARNFRLYAGSFCEDVPHGAFLCIVFAWSKTKRCALHERSEVEFNHGTVVRTEKTTRSNIGGLCGLENEEFLQMYRQGEKVIEDHVARFRLKEVNAEECLWKPVAAESNISVGEATSQ
jgi:hypothetical protein